MEPKRARDFLEEAGAASSDLFCTVHRVAKDRITTLYSSHPQPEPLGSWQRLGSGIVGYAAETEKVVCVGELAKDPHYLIAYPGIRSELAVPISVDGKVAGIINFESSSSNYFEGVIQDHFISLAEELADYFFISYDHDSELLIPESSLLTADQLPAAQILVTEISDALLAEIAKEPLLLHKLAENRFHPNSARK
jgi:GAF domain-containing protein